MFTTLAAVRAARIPSAGLALLAPLRNLSGIRVVEEDGLAWLFWQGERPELMKILLATAGAQLFQDRDSTWVRTGSLLPTHDAPALKNATSLDRVIFPAAIEAIDANDHVLQRVAITLTRCSSERPASALCCALDALLDWADRAPSSEINSIRGSRAGARAWLIGNALPAIPGAERFWGGRLLVPLGWRPQPDWPEKILIQVAGVENDELLVLRSEGAEALPLQAFQPLTRAGIRLAAKN